METLTELYMNSFGKVFNSDHQRKEDHQADDVKREQHEEYLRMRAEERPKKERNVSASIEVPNPSNRRNHRAPDDYPMEELMAAMVLSNMQYSPIFHSQFKGASPRSYDSSGVGSWSQDSRRASPFLPTATARLPGSGTPKLEPGEESSAAMWRASRTPDYNSDADPGTILLQRSTPMCEISESTDKEDETTEEPQDFSMKTLRAKEEEERNQEEQKREELARNASEVYQLSPGQYGLPLPPNTLVPPPLPFPYYFPNPLLQHPYTASLPNEILLRLANSTLKSLSTPEAFGSSAPGYIDSRFHRHAKRPAPYSKINDDSAISSPIRSVSPAMHQIGSAPAAASFRLGVPNSNPIPVSRLSFSPNRHRKMTRSPRPHSSPYSSPSFAPQTSSFPLSKADGMKMSRDFHHHHSKPTSSSWNNTAHFAPNSIQNHKFPTNFYPKSNSMPTQSIPIPFGRKVPGDGKKCRKVYGMENKDQWCTACKWKKACQRFPT